MEPKEPSTGFDGNLFVQSKAIGRNIKLNKLKGSRVLFNSIHANDTTISTIIKSKVGLQNYSTKQGSHIFSPIKLSSNKICLLSVAILTLVTFYSSQQSINGNGSNQSSRNKQNDKQIEKCQSKEEDIIQPYFLTTIDGDKPIRVPLLAELGCPDQLRVSFSGLNDKFVIDLVKNKRLISDRYFELISNDHQKRESSYPTNLFNSNNNNVNNKVGDGETKQQQSEPDSNHMFLNLHNFTTNNQHCHYHGIVNENINTISAISIVNNKLLEGFFHNSLEKNIVYYLHANAKNFSTILTRSITNLGKCNSNSLSRSSHDTHVSTNLQLENIKSSSSSLIRSRRAIKKTRSLPTSSSLSSKSDNYIKHEPFQSNSSSLYVELLVVLDHSQYIEYERNTSFIAERTMQIVNIMNAFYRQLNIFVALVGVVLWTEKDEIQLTNDGDSTLTNFLKYRHEKLLPKYHHDNAQLITSTSFNGSVVGKALKGPICTHEHSGGVNTDHSHSPAIVAVTLAHELGHNLGMEHDEDDKCKCPDEKCIMSSSSSTVHPKHWSSCSIDYLEDSRKHGLLDCLTKRPEKVFGPICGNGFVEEGEDCDLGVLLPTYRTSKSRNRTSPGGKCLDGNCDPNQAVLSNPCCDKKTCKFTTNATCAQGPCCDLSKCSVYNSTEVRVCRKQKDECDFEEVCDGKSEYCPEDTYYHDGIECGPGVSMSLLEKSNDIGRSRAYCYQGRCNSHLSQCNLLWGSSGSVSEDICYDQNVHGNTSGNCGYDRMLKVYNSCEPEDSICGMLHCVHDQGDFATSKKTGKLQYGFESASILTVSFFVMSNHAKIYCHGAIIDSGPNVKDPGMVPDGASCGHDRMCLNQKCVPTSDIMYKNWCPSDCNGNGICDNQGVCHCYDGTIGTSCYQFFGANFHLSLLLYIIIFFVPLVALFVLALNHYKSKIKIWWFLHNRKIELKNKHRAQNHTIGNRRMPGATDIDVGGQKPIISDPIPLNQHNINRPFYEPNQNLNLDPWAETNVGSINNNRT